MKKVLNIFLILLLIFIGCAPAGARPKTRNYSYKQRSLQSETGKTDAPVISPKVIIWDLGDTLFKPNSFKFAREIGLKNVISYALKDGKNPRQLEDTIFSMLHSLKKRSPSSPAARKNDKLLPALMIDWLCGHQTGQDVYAKASTCIEQWDAEGHFVSTSEKKLVDRILKAMFDPLKLARSMKPIKKGLKLLEKCAEQVDSTGAQAHKLFVLSNWDPQSFNYLYSSEHGQKVFKYFKPENVVISGNIGLMKPDPLIFDHILKEHNLTAADCILIDDQAENIEAAKECGMTGLLLEDHNYKKLKKQLEELHVL